MQIPATFSATRRFRVWRGCCRLVARVFYRRFEVSGLDAVDWQRGVILCANHVNALADAVIVQASTSRQIHPLARSGLFDVALLGPLLRGIGAVPVYRRQDKGSDVARNADSFRQCYRMLGQGAALVIFPEGQSHSDPYLHDLKTGAARIALGARRENGVAPLLVPLGLTFTRKGKFRGDVLVQYGTPIDLAAAPELDVAALTARIHRGLAAVTLNADSWADIDLVARVERFFALRHGRYRRESLHQRVRALQRLIEGRRLLLQYEPRRVRSLIVQLRAFERLCRCCGVRDYHLTLHYRPALITLYMLRGLVALLIGLPLALWGLLNSAVPYLLTQHLAQRLARGPDQYDTGKILLGILLFGLCWSLQTLLVWHNFGGLTATGYLTSLVISSAPALRLRVEYRRILTNLKVFLLFMRKQQVRSYLQARRQEIEIELAQLVRIARRLARSDEQEAIST